MEIKDYKKITLMTGIHQVFVAIESNCDGAKPYHESMDGNRMQVVSFRKDQLQHIVDSMSEESEDCFVVEVPGNKEFTSGELNKMKKCPEYE